MSTVIKTGVQILQGFSEGDKDTVKQHLTYENAAYQSAVKYSKWGANVKIPKYLYFYNEKPNGDLEIPFCTDLEALGIYPSRVKNNRISVPVTYPDSQIEIREIQAEAGKAYLGSKGKNNLVLLPTGTGKSVLGIYLAARLNERTLIVVHKTDLLDGWLNDINKVFGGKADVGIIRGAKKKIGNHFTIATIQTLNSIFKNNPDFAEELTKSYGLAILDEVHHASAQSYQLLGNFLAARRLGLTATFERSDNLTALLHEYFGGFAFIGKAQNEDILSVQIKRVNVYDKATIYCYELNDKYVPENAPSLARVSKKILEQAKCIAIENVPSSMRPVVHGRDIERILFDTSNEVRHSTIQGRLGFIETLCSDIVDEAVFKSRSCIIFCSMKEQVDIIYDALRKFLPNTRVVSDLVQCYYGDSEEEDEIIKNRAEKREKLITIATYAKSGEGTNVAAWEVAFLASSTSNGKTVQQAIGRIRRKAPGKRNPVLVYDYRFVNAYILKWHGKKRDERYKLLGFTDYKEVSNGVRAKV